MTKPTAQELWARIEERINTLHSISLNAGTLFPGVTTLQIIQDYAQTYHEEQMNVGKIICPRCNNRTIDVCGTIGCDNLSSNPQPND